MFCSEDHLEFELPILFLNKVITQADLLYVFPWCRNQLIYLQ